MESANKQKPRVLVADDVESIVQLMKHLLVKNDFEVEVAHDGEECLEKIKSYKPDLVVLDIMMPKLHGIDVLKKINEEPRAPGVIICTSKSYKPDLDQAKALGAFDVIEKPFEHKEFLAKVQGYFSGTAAQGMVPPAAPLKSTPETPFLPVLDTSHAILRLWGTRGSIPVSGQGYIRHGGNTSCMSIQNGDDIVIIDAGSGIRELGTVLMKQQQRKIHLFIGHTHWDHIQGFPFFIPAYVPGFEIIIYGASGFGKDLKSIFRGQLDRDYFPVQLEDMNAHLEFLHLTDNPVDINGIKIYWEFTHHPGPTLGFKIQVHGTTIGYITDNEFLKGYLGNPEDIQPESELMNSYSKLIDFISDVDIYIGEAQYPNDEYRSKIGWGHSSLSNACLLTRLAGIKKWFVVHHDPMHYDDFLQNKLNLTKQILRDLKHPIDVCNGFDGMVELL